MRTGAHVSLAVVLAIGGCRKEQDDEGGGPNEVEVSPSTDALPSDASGNDNVDLGAGLPIPDGGALRRQRPIVGIIHNNSYVSELEVSPNSPTQIQIATVNLGGNDEFGCPHFDSATLDVESTRLRLRAFEKYSDDECSTLVSTELIDFELPAMLCDADELVYETMGCSDEQCSPRDEEAPTEGHLRLFCP